MIAGTTVAGSPTTDPRPRAGSADALGAEAGASAAGQALTLLSVVPALLSMAWLVAAFPLAALGQFRAITVVPLAVAAAGVILPLGVGALRRPLVRLSAPWWATLATVTIAAAYAWFVVATHSEQAILRRDAGSYAQIGWWLTHHPALTLSVPAEAFGPSWSALTYGSPGFYQQGDVIVPQFMAGWPTMLAAGGWVAGWQGMFVLPALVGACAILALAGLTARLVGARWAPLAALLMALAWPLMRVSQTTYSEPLACLVLAGGICLLLDVLKLAGRAGSIDAGVGSDSLRRRTRGVAFVCGLVLAGGELVRLDMGVDFALLVPVIGWWWLARRPGVGAFVLGAMVGGGLGVADCLFVTLPYVQTNWSSVRLMIVGVVGMVVVTVALVWALRVWGRSPLELRWWRRLPAFGTTAVVVLAAALVLRPYLHVDHSNATAGVIRYTEEMQAWLGLPIDGTRGYTEHSLWWVSWYLGWPLLGAALVAAAVITARVLRGHDSWWIPVLLVYGVSAVLTLIRPGITPDHPWADRRLVVEVIPAFILLAAWTAATATRLSRSTVANLPRRFRLGLVVPVVPVVVAAAIAATFVTPMLAATAPVAAKRTELGEVAAAETVCAALRPDDSVVLLDTLWVPTIREQCGLPVAQLPNATPQGLAQAALSIRDAGRTPVIAASAMGGLGAVGGTPVEVVTLHTQQDQHQLVRRPDSTDPLVIEFWLVRP